MRRACEKLDRSVQLAAVNAKDTRTSDSGSRVTEPIELGVVNMR